ncbi:MAG: HD domain-containing protein [Chloroflexi bacterium]|nr:HD domain-containing protein [Chloroflexota bacterium]
MTSAQLAYLFPYVASLTLSLGVLVYAYRQRHAQGAQAFVVYVGGQTLWVFGFILELVTPNLALKIFWDGVQWVAGAASLVAFPIFAVQYTEFRLKNSRQLFHFSLIVPSVLFFMLLTDFQYHWIYARPELIVSGPFSELKYEFTAFVYFYAAYSYGMILTAILIVAQRFFRPHNLYRAQVVTIILGFLVPVFGTILPILSVRLIPQRDPAPLTIGVGNLIIAWGLFRFRLFQVVPVGRDRVFEEMVDPVVILDRGNTIVDINRAMLDLLGRTAADTVGQSAKLVFNDFPIPIKLFTDVSHARTEAHFQVESKMVHYELSVWPLIDHNHQITGRVYVCHDITAMKELEGDLRKLNLALEQRVQLRTRELAEAYDTTLEGWARTLELKDRETEGHSRRVTETTLKVARALKIPEDEIIHIHRGALLHDIGKMAIPDEILHKTGPFTAEERAVMQKHPEIAYELLRQIPYLFKALDIPYCHHERWDGSGYPRGLKGRAIPLAARIFAVVDVWDAVQSDRPYNQRWSKENTVAYLKEQAGILFDPYVLDVFLRLVERGEI